MNLPGRFLTEAQVRALICTANEGAFWAHGQFWLVRGSRYNPSPHRHILLLGCFGEPRPAPPTPEAVDELVALLSDTIPSSDRPAFEVQAAILRATAKEYYE